MENTRRKYGKQIADTENKCCLSVALEAAGIQDDTFDPIWGLVEGQMVEIALKYFSPVEFDANTLGEALKAIPNQGTYLVCVEIADGTAANKTISGDEPSSGRLFWKNNGKAVFDGYDEHVMTVKDGVIYDRHGYPFVRNAEVMFLGELQ